MEPDREVEHRVALEHGVAVEHSITVEHGVADRRKKGWMDGWMNLLPVWIKWAMTL